MVNWFHIFSYALMAVLLPLGSVRAETGLIEYVENSNAVVVISELQTGGINTHGLEDGRQEFIELFNQTSDLLDVSGWELQYFSATRTGVLDGEQDPTRSLYTFNGSLAGYGFMTISFHDYLEEVDGYFGEDSTSNSGLLAKSGGHIRIIDKNRQIIDVVGWGSAGEPEEEGLPVLPAGHSAKRYSDIQHLQKFADTDNNLADFLVDEILSPMTGGYIELIVHSPEEEEPNEEEPSQPQVTCDNLQITEVLPNPEGSDFGQEFIELYNPTKEAISLNGCNLKTSANSKTFEFNSNETIKAGEYRAFFDSITGLTLANAAGGEVWLFGVSTDFVAQYPPELDSDIAWALIGDIWQDTAMPTPGALNELPEFSNEPESTEGPVPCPEGKFRNPDTNRCKTIESSSQLTPCKVGQVRNPDTNRCRNAVSLTSSLMPCKPGQERNPDTNRCRNVLSSTKSLQPCQDGYQRNPDTNRCRKIPSVLAASPSVGSAVSASPTTNYAFLAIITTLIVGYGLFEYRRDITNWLQQRKAKLTNTTK